MRGSGRALLDIFELIVFVFWVAFWSYWFLSAWRTRSPVKRRQSSRFIFLPLLVLILIWLVLVQFLDSGFLLLEIVPDTIGVALAGVCITLIGLGFAIWARVHLGTNWSSQPAIRVEHKLVRTGPYKIVRNPIYTGILFGFVGTALVINQMWAVLAILIILTTFLVKIRMEEKVLREEFGDDFIQYKREVKAFIPFIW
jgi:protein-S-isoprenylcysteine O-methyltransferase Ste14